MISYAFAGVLLKHLWGWLVLCLCLSSSGFALSENIGDSLLSRSTTLVLDPPELNESDYALVWSGPALEGVRANIVPGSAQWVRIGEVLVLARARVAISVPGRVRGTVKHQGAVQSFESDGKNSSVEILAALIASEKNPMEVTLQSADGKSKKASLYFKVNHMLSESKRVHVDPSCSSYRVEVENSSLQPSSWAFVGCRLVYSKKEGTLVPSLEVYVFWDGVGQTVSIDGTPTESNQLSVWPLRLRSSPGRVHFSETSEKDGKKQEMLLSYRIRPELHLGNFGVGLGPYSYRYATTGGTDNVNDPTGVFTFYGSYFFNHYMRAVLFSILPIHKKIFNDTGLYLLVEQARILDNRLSINFLLGGHGISFPYGGKQYFRFSFPQGIELVFRDLFGPRQNLMFGAFAYPFAGDREYYNVWLRWGMGPYFGEINYMKWREIVSTGTLAGAELWGVSFGMPLVDFL